MSPPASERPAGGEKRGPEARAGVESPSGKVVSFMHSGPATWPPWRFNVRHA